MQGKLVVALPPRSDFQQMMPDRIKFYEATLREIFGGDVIAVTTCLVDPGFPTKWPEIPTRIERGTIQRLYVTDQSWGVILWDLRGRDRVVRIASRMELGLIAFRPMARTVFTLDCLEVPGSHHHRLQRWSVE